MVRINIIDPKILADQHLVAEYVEIMMLVGHVKRFPLIDDIPKNYCLGRGHIKFFKNKLSYLKKRHEIIKKEMNKRGFVTNKKLNLKNFGKMHLQDWKPDKEDEKIIKLRIIEKIKIKPHFYRYYGEYKGKEFLINILN